MVADKIYVPLIFFPSSFACSRVWNRRGLPVEVSHRFFCSLENKLVNLNWLIRLAQSSSSVLGWERCSGGLFGSA